MISTQTPIVIGVIIILLQIIQTFKIPKKGLKTHKKMVNVIKITKGCD